MKVMGLFLKLWSILEGLCVVLRDLYEVDNVDVVYMCFFIE